jgi:hypothetical protein
MPHSFTSTKHLTNSPFLRLNSALIIHPQTPPPPLADYPTSPFFLRVVSPRMVMYTGHVTAGGSICIEALVPTGTQHGWQPTYTVEGMLVRREGGPGAGSPAGIAAQGLPPPDQQRPTATAYEAAQHCCAHALMDTPRPVCAAQQVTVLQNMVHAEVSRPRPRAWRDPLDLPSLPWPGSGAALPPCLPVAVPTAAARHVTSALPPHPPLRLVARCHLIRRWRRSARSRAPAARRARFEWTSAAGRRPGAQRPSTRFRR